MRLDVVLRVVTKLLLPFMVMFGFYIHFHGDYIPGGGFQGGVVIAAAVILYAIMFGLDRATRVLPVVVVEKMVSLGVVIFAGTGVATMLLGGNFLDYDMLAADPVKGQHMGILIIELGVLISVTGTMLAIFYAFAGRGR
ncbi:multisubunit sodium/proton antiporter MrpB subunit [Tepidamorphus gemmatus]|jgi:multicomponent Na+:H+ antiporter subunit B|uniref:Multisubunit sodium/proton antiporter MrpB subunit n=1 Tax=Tepidamorphus gemmatus TaxID=747076 RepID=A0A4R3LWL6_9HYPH|nr:Na(+)/H(+) antiporter subunit B [Tepidamorphus gemmatus]TCT04149.1 multisubunit sodium/proton antiporter MrpB subunit [Tepidamorphus gemmatus]